MGEDEFLDPPPAHGRWLHRMVWVAAVALVLNLIFAGWVVLRPEVYNPLGDYPVQVVGLPHESVPLNGSATVVYPTLRVVGDAWPDVPVDAVKCANEQTNVKGQTSWREVVPPGFIAQASAGYSERTVGCTKFHYQDRVPDDVRARVVEQVRGGTNVTLWQIGGEEIPLDDAGRPGASRVWESENFAIEWSES